MLEHHQRFTTTIRGQKARVPPGWGGIEPSAAYTRLADAPGIVFAALPGI